MVITSSHSTCKMGFINSPRLARGAQRFLEKHWPLLLNGSLEILILLSARKQHQQLQWVNDLCSKTEGQASQRQDEVPSETPSSTGCCQKELPIIRVGFPTSVMANSTVFHRRLPCSGHSDLWQVAIKTHHESCRGRIPKEPVAGQTSGKQVGHVS